MERIFDQIGEGTEIVPQGDEEANNDYERRIKALIEDAIDFEESSLSPAREKNTKFYYGKEPALEAEDGVDPNDPNAEDPGRNTVVSTDVRDTVLAILPSLMRIFCSAENVVDFVPNTQEGSDAAAQQTDYVNYVFWEDNPGFMILYNVFKDMLTVKTGVVTWWTDTEDEVEELTFQNVTMEQLQALIFEDEDAEVVDLQQTSEEFIDSVTIRHMKSKPVHKIAPVPPDEFRIDRNATSVETSALTGWDRYVYPSELYERGYDEYVDIEQYVGSGGNQIGTAERLMRNEGLDQGSTITEMVRFGQYYIRADKDGDGVAELRYVCTIGDNHDIFIDEVVPFTKFAVFCPDPRPHTVVGDCPADLVTEIQTIKTNMIRGVLDSLAQSIHSRTVVNELVTNLEDAMNDQLGALIRTKGDPSSAVHEISHTFVGQQALTVIDYVDRIKQMRTGISEASKGVDPKALQSTNLMGIDAIVSGAQERIELIARVAAETGMKTLFKGLLREVCYNPNPKRTIEMRGQWVDVNPSLFDPNLRVKVNPTLGKGSDQTRLMALQTVAQTQKEIIGQFGIANPVVTPKEYLNTITDILALSNIKNVTRYFRPIDEQTMQAINSAPKEPDPATLVAMAEMEKVRAQAAKALAEKMRLETKDAMDDDFRRDKLTIDAILKIAEILKQEPTEQPMIEAKNQPNG